MFYKKKKMRVVCCQFMIVLIKLPWLHSSPWQQVSCGSSPPPFFFIYIIEYLIFPSFPFFLSFFLSLSSFFIDILSVSILTF
ncbi:hypothetical protein BD770DRAFT_377987 [Pilaira anomala]|nr:hypothetical protein BD770DRAFT_377987 [Pilaira anomala]